MSSDYWNRRVKANLVKKLNKYLTLPAFAHTNGFSEHCIDFPGYNGIVIHEEPSVTMGGLFDFAFFAWVYNIPADVDSGVKSVFCINDTGLNVRPINILIEDNCVKVILYIGGYSTTLFSTRVPAYKWFHLAVRWDDTVLSVYIDGVKDATTGSIAGPFAIPAVQYNTIGGYLVGGNPTGYFSGKVSNIVFFDDNVPEEYVLHDITRECLRGPDTTPTDLDANMLYQYRLNEGSGNPVETLSGDTAKIMLFGDAAWDTETPVHFNCSYVCSEYSATISEKFSIVHPVAAPSGADFALVVRWLDDDSEVQRKIIFTVDGVVFPFDIEDYNGEALPTNAVFEIWGIDGSESATLATALNIDISILTDPTESYDLTQVQEVALVGNSSLATTYPLTFPLTFNTQQTY